MNNAHQLHLIPCTGAHSRLQQKEIVMDSVVDILCVDIQVLVAMQLRQYLEVSSINGVDLRHLKIVG